MQHLIQQKSKKFKKRKDGTLYSASSLSFNDFFEICESWPTIVKSDFVDFFDNEKIPMHRL